MKRDDRGATAVFLAFVLLLLIGVAAVAVDLGRGWVERRQDQTAADVGAIAGALSADESETAIVDQVMQATRANLDNTYTDPEWDGLWQDCGESGLHPPAGFVAAEHETLGELDCIGLNPSFIWVRLPEQTIDTTFGRAIGFDSITTGAEATATLLNETGSGALPFAIRGNAGTGEVCLDTGTGGAIEDPCEENEEGSFGNIAPPLFGNEALNTSPSCGSQSSANNYVPESIAMGIDHVLWEFDEDDWNTTGWDPNDNTGNMTVDGEATAHLDKCEEAGGPLARPADGVPINTVLVDTGNNTKADVTEGMMTGTGFPDGEDARLTRSTNIRTVHGYELDNAALWEFLLDEPAHPECTGSIIRGLPTIEDKNDAMADCLETYPASGGEQIFTDAILQTPRVGVAPRLWHNNLGSGISYRPIKKFEVVYIHALWLKDGGSAVPFFPDDGNAEFNDGTENIEQVTAFLLTDGMVSENVLTSLGGFANDTWQPFLWK